MAVNLNQTAHCHIPEDCNLRRQPIRSVDFTLYMCVIIQNCSKHRPVHPFTWNITQNLGCDDSEGGTVQVFAWKECRQF